MIFQTPLLTAILALAQPTGPVTWSFSAVATDGGLVRIEMVAKLEAGWHMYATHLPSDDGPIATEFRFTPSKAYVLNGKLEEPEPHEEYDQNFAMVVRHHSNSPRFVQNVRVVSKEAFTVEGEVEYMVCNDKTCLPPVVVPFKVRVEPAAKK